MVDYSKWKNIEISDDEDETHPNIDTPSLFRWRHKARVERMEEHQKKMQDHTGKVEKNRKEIRELKEKLETAPKTNSTEELEKLKKELSKLEIESKKLAKENEELQKEEKMTPWNVDTISKPGFAKTVINKKPQRPPQENLSEEEREKKMKQFVKENEKILKHFGMLRRYDDSKEYLKKYGELVCEDTANYLVIWCINVEMEEKHDLMEHVAHQTICMQYILELAKQLDYDPRACVDAFFSKIQVADVEYKKSFDDELSQFKGRIRKRAAEKLEEAIKEMEEEEKQKRLGPGGLDPVEVFEHLPPELQKCFEVQDVQMLQDAIAKMDEKDAKFYLKQCVDSGLWVPDAKNKEADEAGDGQEKTEQKLSE